MNKRRQTRKQTLIYREQTEGLGGEVGGIKRVTCFKECTCCDERPVLYVSDESLNSTPGTNIALYVNELKFK